jgi:DNA-binding MarR family transcriptional regulator
VTRMVRALQKLGLVQRWRDDWDRRQVLVALTKAGKRCIRRARNEMLPRVKRVVYGAICFGQHRSVNARFLHMSRLESYLQSLRWRFNDTAGLYYPWGHPDD